MFSRMCSLGYRVLTRMCSLGVSLRQYVDHQTRAQGGGEGGGVQGELVFPNGDVYEGELFNDLPHGEGRYVCVCMCVCVCVCVYEREL